MTKQLAQSMTGYAEANYQSDDTSFFVRIKSVNSKILDINLKLPLVLSSWEAEIRKMVKSRLTKGRIELVVNFNSEKIRASEAEINQGLTKSLLKNFREFAAQSKINSPENFQDLISIFAAKPELLAIKNPDLPANSLKKEKKLFLEILEDCLADLIKSRAVEGDNLIKAINQAHRKLVSSEKVIAALHKKEQKNVFKKLTDEIAKLLEVVNFSSDKVAEEAAFRVEKRDIKEELVRIKSHLDQFGGNKTASLAGKKIEFLAQELLREFNTIASKASDSKIHQEVIEAKLLIDQIKEQSLNLE